MAELLSLGELVTLPNRLDNRSLGVLLSSFKPVPLLISELLFTKFELFMLEPRREWIEDEAPLFALPAASSFCRKLFWHSRDAKSTCSRRLLDEFRPFSSVSIFVACSMVENVTRQLPRSRSIFRSSTLPNRLLCRSMFFSMISETLCIQMQLVGIDLPKPSLMRFEKLPRFSPSSLRIAFTTEQISLYCMNAYVDVPCFLMSISMISPNTSKCSRK